jgi:Lrp/AsnC family leucine-responsive transcriptional regulator
MDKVDIVLIQLLLANSRLSYSELAEKLGLSVNAVHKRIQLLVEAGVIRKFTAKVNLLTTNAIVVFVSGISQMGSLHDLPDKMKTQGSIYWLAIGGGNYLYIGAYIRSLTELEPLVTYIKKEAGIPEPTVGITDFPLLLPLVHPKASDLALHELDYQIIRSLKDNSRKAISDVADELGISAKTARRRLQRMIKNGLIELTIEWYPDASNDIMTLIQLHLKPEIEKGEIYNIFRKYSPNMLFYWSYSNIPNTITYTVWTNTMKELQSLREKLEKEESVVSVMPNILYIGYILKTWRDQLIEK